MLQYFVQVQYCYDFLVEQIPMGLLLYSHLPAALLAVLFSTYVLIKAKSFPSFLFFNLSLTFAIWTLLDLSAWFSFLGSQTTMFTWSLLDFGAVLMFFFAYYFLYTFVSGKDLPWMQKLFAFTLLVPIAAISFLGLNIVSYDLNSCIAIENGLFTRFTYVAEALILLASLVFTVRSYRSAKNKDQRGKTLLAGTGVLVLLTFLFTSSFLVSLFASSDASSYVYNYLIYGLFGMPVFLVYLGYVIVRYHAFDIKIFATQALVVGLIVVIGSEFSFVHSFTNRVLVGITLLLTSIVGIILIRSVKKEIEQREHIELLAKDLEKSNKQQIILIHFITHQIKGFVTKSRNIFAGLREGDYGKLPESMVPMIEEGFRSDTKGVQTIQEILSAANIKSGKVTYSKEVLDLKSLLESVILDLTPFAVKKGLVLNSDLAPISYTGDKIQLINAFKNLIDNSIKYTPSGTVSISLSQAKGSIRFELKDTGVGISEDDMKNLFTEGGRGKDSQKINVESTGFGLYIVKNIIEAHGGKVWAESEGTGKGARFMVELPA